MMTFISKFKYVFLLAVVSMFVVSCTADSVKDTEDTFQMLQDQSSDSGSSGSSSRPNSMG